MRERGFDLDSKVHRDVNHEVRSTSFDESALSSFWKSQIKGGRKREERGSDTFFIISSIGMPRKSNQSSSPCFFVCMVE